MSIIRSKRWEEGTLTFSIILSQINPVHTKNSKRNFLRNCLTFQSQIDIKVLNL